MSDVFISYERSTAKQAQAVADALRAQGYAVWRDDELPAHRDYSEVIEERLRAAKAVVVIWSAGAVKSQWVRAEADLAREAGTLVQLTLDGAPLPMPFNRIQCADMTGWSGDLASAGWQKVAGSVSELVGNAPAPKPVVDVGIEASRPLPSAPSIAVLPLANLSGDPEQDYFADGMAVEIVTALSRFPALFVIASSSSLSFREPAVSRRTIADELGVRYLLEGSVRKSGQRVRIAVELLNPREGTQVWAERFDGTLEDVFALQDAVATGVSAQIAPAVEASEMRRTGARTAAELGAYDLLLRARHAVTFWNADAFSRAIALLDEAIEREPDYAQALALAALCNGYAPQAGWSDDPDFSRRRARELCRRAIQAGADIPEVLADTAMAITFIGGDLVAADAMIERAIARNPSLASAWLCSGWIKAFCGKAREGLRHLETADRLDPRAPHRSNLLSGMGFCLLLLGRYEEAVLRLKESKRLLANQYGTWTGLVAALAYAGHIEEAQSTLKRLDPAHLKAMLSLMRDIDDREIVRAGLALAGADV
ncbi:MAG TPA: TIR domain-containing protein [Caulobacteraceae bacterium]|jgi:adenylate cyclase